MKNADARSFKLVSFHSLFNLLKELSLFLFEQAPRVQNLPHCLDQLSPISGLVGPVNMLSENGCVYRNMSFSERKSIE